MRLLPFLVVAVALSAAEARASCARLSSFCFCSAPSRFGLVVTEALDGARATVRVERAGAGLSDGQVLTLPRAASEVVGARWLVRDDLRQGLDAEGTVGCAESLGTASPRLPIDVVLAALASPETCDASLEAQGFTAPCDDIGGCSTGPAGAALAVAVVGLLRRRRRVR